MIAKMFFLVLLSILAFSCAVPNPDSNKKDRILDKPLSDQPHYSENEAHNSEYDHDAFLGEEEAREFDQLSPEESKERLGKIVDKIDKDKDGFVTEEELKDWIKYTQSKYTMDDVEKQWKNHNLDTKDALDWESYKKFTFHFTDEDQSETDDEDVTSYKKMMARDKKRWAVADRNADNQLTKEEFADFLHPEDAKHMHEVVIAETIEDIDKDGDGKISMAEYIGDMYSGTEEDEPDWVKNEKESFTEYRDKDKDGHMDKAEVREWIMPADYNNAESEAVHLIGEADENKDKKLSKEEIINNYDVFVGSQATDFGEALTRHDEF